MAATFHHLAPPGRVSGAPAGALVCLWALDPTGRLVGRWSQTPREPVRPAPAA
jgi:hypothetical protein